MAAEYTEVLISRTGDRTDIVITAGGKNYCYHNLKIENSRIVWKDNNAETLQEFLISGVNNADGNGDMLKRTEGLNSSPAG